MISLLIFFNHVCERKIGYWRLFFFIIDFTTQILAMPKIKMIFRNKKGKSDEGQRRQKVPRITWIDSNSLCLFVCLFVWDRERYSDHSFIWKTQILTKKNTFWKTSIEKCIENHSIFIQNVFLHFQFKMSA